MLSQNSPQITKDNLQTLYLSGNSMNDIAQKLHCSVHKVVYWMEKYGLKRRSRSEATYLKLNPSGDPYKIKPLLTQKDSLLYGLGMGIYWGEGEKASLNAVRVANSNPFIILNFRKFLREICCIKESKISYSLVCFNDSSPREAKKFWSTLLRISEEKFGKIVQIPPQGKGVYKRKSQFGVCTITVSNTKLKAWILEELDKYTQTAWIA